MPAILISVLAAVINGATPAAAIGALTTSQWLTLGESAAEAIAPELASRLGLKVSGNSIGGIVDSVFKLAADELGKAQVRSWLSANADEAMKLQPGMGTDY